MSVISLILLLLLSLSMHACNARVLGLIKKETTTGNLQEITVSSILQGVMKNYGGSSNLIESWGVKPYLMKEDETTTRTSGTADLGDDRVVMGFQKGIQEPVKTEVSKRQFRRSMLGMAGSSTLHDQTKKPKDSKQNDDSVEHVDVMDYAQPHRKPPIHNEKN